MSVTIFITHVRILRNGGHAYDIMITAPYKSSRDYSIFITVYKNMFDMKKDTYIFSLSLSFFFSFSFFYLGGGGGDRGVIYINDYIPIYKLNNW